MAISREERARRASATGVFWHIYRSFVGWMLLIFIGVPVLIWIGFMVFAHFDQQSKQQAIADQQAEKVQYMMASLEHPVLAVLHGAGPEQPKPVPEANADAAGPIWMDDGAVRCVIGYISWADNVEFVSKGPGGVAYFQRSWFTPVANPTKADIDKACKGAS